MQVSDFEREALQGEQEAAAAQQQLADSEEAYEMLQEACCSMQQHQAEVLDKQASLEQELAAAAAVRQQYSELQGHYDDLLTGLEQAQDQVCQHCTQHCAQHCILFDQRGICVLRYFSMTHTWCITHGAAQLAHQAEVLLECAGITSRAFHICHKFAGQVPLLAGTLSVLKLVLP